MVDYSLQPEYHQMDRSGALTDAVPAADKIVYLVPKRDAVNNRDRLAQAARVQKKIRAKFSDYHLLKRMRQIEKELNQSIRDN